MACSLSKAVPLPVPIVSLKQGPRAFLLLKPVAPKHAEVLTAPPDWQRNARMLIAKGERKFARKLASSACEKSGKPDSEMTRKWRPPMRGLNR